MRGNSPLSIIYSLLRKVKRKNCMVFKYSILVPNISIHKDKTNSLLFFAYFIIDNSHPEKNHLLDFTF